MMFSIREVSPTAPQLTLHPQCHHDDSVHKAVQAERTESCRLWCQKSVKRHPMPQDSADGVGLEYSPPHHLSLLHHPKCVNRTG